jgi:hypothetical protein
MAAAIAVGASTVIAVTSIAGSASAASTITVDQKANRLVLSWALPASDTFKIDTGFPFWAPWTQDGRYPTSVLDTATVPRGTYTATITGLKGGQVTGTATGQVKVGEDTTVTTLPSGTGKLAVTVSVVGSKASLNWSHPASGAPASYKIDTGFPWWGPWTQDGRWAGSALDVGTVPAGTYQASVSALNSSGAVLAIGAVDVIVGRGGGTTTTAPASTTSSTTSSSSTTIPIDLSGDSLSTAITLGPLPSFVSGQLVEFRPREPGGVIVGCSNGVAGDSRPGIESVGLAEAKYYRFSATADATVYADSSGSGQDTSVIVWQVVGKSLPGAAPAVKPVFCAADGFRGSNEAALRFPVSNGVEYIIGVGRTAGRQTYVQLYVAI